MCTSINKIIIVISLLFLCNISYSSDFKKCLNSPYKGTFIPGKLKHWDNGCIGKHIFPNGNFYEGPFFNGMPNGYGYWYDSTGAWFAGDFVNGLRNGKGTYKYANGQIYVGDWYNNNPDGKGVMVEPNGRIWKGTFKGNKIENSGYKKLNGRYYSPESLTINMHKRAMYNFEIKNEESIEAETNNDMIDISEAKANCKDIGFKEGTEKFGECVLELTK